MPISITKYIDITSLVAGAGQVPQRQLIARCFTTNPLLPTKSFGQFSSANDVGTYFGFSSEEYLRAAAYFAFISKKARKPKLISFARWTDADAAPLIFGSTPPQTAIGAWQAITGGALSLTLAGVNHVITGIDLSACVSLAQVAAAIQAAIRAADAAAVWTAAVVAYDAVGNRFTFTGGAAGVVNTIAVAIPGTGTDVTAPLGWTTPGAIISQGANLETLTETLVASAAASNNFGSIVFMTSLELDTVQKTEVATWNSQQNVLFQYFPRTTLTEVADDFAAMSGLAGTGAVLAPDTTQFPEMLPAAVMAATDYNAKGGVVNYMYQQTSGQTASVTDDPTANSLDGQRINYYGQTQEAGTSIAFFQNGVLFGGATAPVDMNTYANEQWLKSAMVSVLLSFFLAVDEVPADTDGETQITAQILSVVNDALNNGTITVGKPLTQTQIAAINDLSGSATAWQQVQTIGYWLQVAIASEVIDSQTVWVATYTLIYSKDDAIRKVEGTHDLI